MLVIQMYENGPRLQCWFDLFAGLSPEGESVLRDALAQAVASMSEADAAALPPEFVRTGRIDFELGTRYLRLNPQYGIKSCRLTIDAPRCIVFQRDREAERAFLHGAAAEFREQQARAAARRLANLPLPNPQQLNGPLTGQKESA